MRNRSLALLLCLGLVVGLACHTTSDCTPRPNLRWLSGNWHGTLDPEVQLTWSQPTADGMGGVAQDRRTYSVLAIERQAGRYRLCVRDFGHALAAPEGRRGARFFDLVEEGPREARFACVEKGFPRIIEFDYCAYRTSPGILRVQMMGAGPARQDLQTFLYEQPSS